jgi:hypothetical protein
MQVWVVLRWHNVPTKFYLNSSSDFSAKKMQTVGECVGVRVGSHSCGTPVRG